MIIQTRPSAVLKAVFENTSDNGQTALVAFAVIASLLLIVEAFSLVIGVSLSRTITDAVHFQQKVFTPEFDAKMIREVLRQAVKLAISQLALVGRHGDRVGVALHLPFEQVPHIVKMSWAVHNLPPDPAAICCSNDSTSVSESSSSRSSNSCARRAEMRCTRVSGWSGCAAD